MIVTQYYDNWKKAYRDAMASGMDSTEAEEYADKNGARRNIDVISITYGVIMDNNIMVDNHEVLCLETNGMGSIHVSKTSTPEFFNDILAACSTNGFKIDSNQQLVD